MIFSIFNVYFNISSLYSIFFFLFIFSLKSFLINCIIYIIPNNINAITKNFLSLLIKNNHSTYNFNESVNINLNSFCCNELSVKTTKNINVKNAIKCFK